jgi:His-Xaa-Ser system protein HxsD
MMTEEKKIEIKIDLSIYNKVAAIKTCYVFQDRFHTSVEAEAGSMAIARLTSKNESIDLIDIENQFKDELIDQQIRLDNEKLFYEIRKLIVEQAFKPISYSELKAKNVK